MPGAGRAVAAAAGQDHRGQARARRPRPPSRGQQVDRRRDGARLGPVGGAVAWSTISTSRFDGTTKMTPSSSAVASSTILIGSVEWRARISPRWLGRRGSRCWAMTIGAGKSRRQVGHDPRQRLDPARGRADDDELRPLSVPFPHVRNSMPPLTAAGWSDAPAMRDFILTPNDGHSASSTRQVLWVDPVPLPLGVGILADRQAPRREACPFGEGLQFARQTCARSTDSPAEGTFPVVVNRPSREGEPARQSHDRTRSISAQKPSVPPPRASSCPDPDRECGASRRAAAGPRGGCRQPGSTRRRSVRRAGRSPQTGARCRRPTGP